MKFKTLSLIHKLLEEEKTKQLSAFHKARDNYNNAVDEEKEQSIIEVYKNLNDTCWEKYSEALNALNDFEDTEW